MPNKGNFENEKLSLDPVTVNSYGEVFRTIHKKKIRRRPFRDGTTIISACEMKLQILQTAKKQQIQKIIPHVDLKRNFTSPGIKLGFKLQTLFQSASSTGVGDVFGMLPPLRQPTEGAELVGKPPQAHTQGGAGMFGKNLSSSGTGLALFAEKSAVKRSAGARPNTPVFGEQDKEEIGDNGNGEEEYLKEGIHLIQIQNQNSPLDEIRSLTSHSSGSDWSPGGIEMNEATGFWSFGDIKNKHQGHCPN